MDNFAIFSESNCIAGNFNRYALIAWQPLLKEEKDFVKDELSLFVNPFYHVIQLVCNIDRPYGILNEFSQEAGKRTPIFVDIPERAIKKVREGKLNFTMKLIVPICSDKEAKSKLNNRKYSYTLYLNEKGVLKLLTLHNIITVLDDKGDKIKLRVIQERIWEPCAE